jgi:hypothetical protein
MDGFVAGKEVMQQPIKQRSTIEIVYKRIEKMSCCTTLHHEIEQRGRAAGATPWGARDMPTGCCAHAESSSTRPG